MRASQVVVARAPAKINLSLSVLGRREDGWHDLVSLVAFARFGDRLHLLPDAELQVGVSGPMASGIGPEGDNLVLRAALNFAAGFPGARLGSFELVKNLPVAAGMGGGSSDAAAALRLLAWLNGIKLADPRLAAVAQGVGADVPVCLEAVPRFMSGLGADLGPALALPPLFAVLVHPGVPLATPQVFAAMGLQKGAKANAGRTPVLAEADDRAGVIAALKRSGNDMEDAAARLAPVIVSVLSVLSAAPGCKLARMSGSGATCFGLFGNRQAASRAARIIGRDHPSWWVKATLLG